MYPGNTLLTKALSNYLELHFLDSAFINGNPESDTCRLNKLPIISTLQNCFSESPWKGSDRQVESEKWLHT